MANFLTETEMARSFQQLEPIEKAADFTVPAFYGERTYLVDSSAGDVEVTLPAALACGIGATLVLAHAVDGNTITATPAGTDTINGSASPATTSTIYTTITLIRRLSGWLVTTAVS